MSERDSRQPEARTAVVAARLRYEHTLRSLERQSAVLTELRTRASIVLSATGIVASLVGPRALTSRTPLVLAVTALVLLARGLAACVAVLTGAYGISSADALGYGIILQAVEIATAVLMGMPALVKEGLSWRDVRLRALHSTPVRLPARPRSARQHARERISAGA